MEIEIFQKLHNITKYDKFVVGRLLHKFDIAINIIDGQNYASDKAELDLLKEGLKRGYMATRLCIVFLT